LCFFIGVTGKFPGGSATARPDSSDGIPGFGSKTGAKRNLESEMRQRQAHAKIENLAAPVSYTWLPESRARAGSFFIGIPGPGSVLT